MSVCEWDIPAEGELQEVSLLCLDTGGCRVGDDDDSAVKDDKSEAELRYLEAKAEEGEEEEEEEDNDDACTVLSLDPCFLSREKLWA